MTLTIFTPAYNRAKTLPRLYESLLAQTNYDFEWLIVDDGSMDHTGQMVQTFTGEGLFPVRYFYKENGGKHTAYNAALEIAAGDWFFCVDSDDYLTPTAVGTLVSAAARLQENQGIIAYKENLAGKRMSDKFPNALQFSRMNELAIKHRCTGEFSLIFPTKLARKYPFPIFKGERFVTESVIYDRIDRECEMLLLPETVTICEYLADGYTRSFDQLMGSSPSGFCLYFKQRIDLQTSFGARMVCGGKYWCFRWISGNSGIRYDGEYRLETYLSWPLGLLFRIYYKIIRGF